MDFNLKLENYVDWKAYSVTKIKKGFGYRIVLIYSDGTEKVQQRSGFKTKKEANKDRDNIIGQLYSGTYAVYKNILLKEFLQFWLEKEIKPRVASHSYITYRNAVGNYIIPAIGNLEMGNITKKHIQQLYKSEVNSSISRAKITKVVIDTSMRYALSKKIISENPALNVSLPKSYTNGTYPVRNIKTKKTLTISQGLLLIEASKKTPIYMQVLFAFCMGLRRGEMLGVKYSDIDYINRTLKVQRQLGVVPNTQKADFEKGTYTTQEIPLKTKSSYRTIPIPDYVFEAILEQKKIYEKNRDERKEKFQDLGYICCASSGRPYSSDFHRLYFKKLLKDIGLPDIRWHDLRSSFCTILLKNNYSPKAVSRLLGHSKEIITVDFYGDMTEIIEDCLEELQPFIDDVLLCSSKKSNIEDDVVIDVSDYIES